MLLFGFTLLVFGTVTVYVQLLSIPTCQGMTAEEKNILRYLKYISIPTYCTIFGRTVNGNRSEEVLKSQSFY